MAPITEPNNRRVLLGVLAWLAFSLLAIAVRGVRWDENWEFAQVLTGAIPYPAGHPLPRFLGSAYGIQTYATAWLAALGAGPVLVNALRNLLYLLATVLPVFLLTTQLTGKTRWGHLATALTLEGILLEFDGSYPTGVWPWIYSNGHIGGGAALLTVWAILAKRWGLASLLCMLMPAIHIGQAPPIFMFYFAALFFEGRISAAPPLRRVLPFASIGILVCALLAVYMSFRSSPSVLADPWVPTGDTTAIWRGYVDFMDPHRHFSSVNIHIGVFMAFIIASLSALLPKSSDSTTPGLLAFYLLAIVVSVYPIMLLHLLMQDNTPQILLQWLPYRLLNHVPPLLLALLVVALGAQRRHSLLLPLALLLAASRPLFGPLLGETLYMSYLFGGECILFALFGAALATASTPARAWLFLSLALLALAPFHQFGAACTALGALCALLLNRLPELPSKWTPPLLATACAVALSTGLLHQWNYRAPLPRSPFDKEVAAYLAAHDDPRAFLVAPQETYSLQARTGKPILVEAATASHLSYVPSLGPLIQQLHEDLYGLRFDRPVQPKPWEQVWRERSGTEWHHLAQKYNFHYLVAPSSVKLDLPMTIKGDSEILYHVP